MPIPLSRTLYFTQNIFLFIIPFRTEVLNLSRPFVGIFTHHHANNVYLQYKVIEDRCLYSIIKFHCNGNTIYSREQCNTQFRRHMCIFHYNANIIYSREQCNTQLGRHMCIFHCNGNTIYSREQYYPKNQLKQTWK